MDIKVSGEITLGFIKDIADTVTYYKLQDATLDPPDAPTTETPTGWSETEPEYDPEEEGKLYSVTKTTFTDGTFSYSEVSLSSSFKAANQAFVKALLAKDTADAAAEEAGNASTAASEAQAAANQATAAASTAQTTADEAAKVATNFLAFEDGTGLVVGDMTADTLRANTLISANGVSIRDGETELATFSESLIEIGKSSGDATIDFRNGNFTMSNFGVNGDTVHGTELTSKQAFFLSVPDDRSYFGDREASIGSVLISGDYPFKYDAMGANPDDYIPGEGELIIPGMPPMGVRGNVEQHSAAFFAQDKIPDPNTPEGTPIEDGQFINLRAGIEAKTMFKQHMNWLGEWLEKYTHYSELEIFADRYKIANPDKFREALGIGSGGGSKYAAISVSYPTGAYCYCENEELDILYEATDTVGEYTFSIPEEALGTWKVTVVMEDNTMVRTVTLSEDNRTAHLDMPAFMPLYVDGVLTEEYGAFKMSGYKHTTNVGDWNTFTLTITNTNGVLDLRYTRDSTSHNQSSGYATFNRPIDLTYVKRIAIKLSSIPGNTPRLRLYQTLANGTGVASALLNAVYTELDVSELTGSYYVTLALQGGTNTTHFYVEDWRLIM